MVFPLVTFLTFACLLVASINPANSEIAYESCAISSLERLALQRQLSSMFDHAYSNYITHAFPLDEVRPLSCSGLDTFGGLSVTLIDTLDAHLVFGTYPDFVRSARYLRRNLTFDRNASVSVFETTIRVLGGLLSAHGLLTDAADAAHFDAWLWYPDYDGALLWLALDLADRLLPAFATVTGIPFGAINLRYGVAADESRVASTAGAGSLLLELGTLSVLTGDRRYYGAAFGAMEALHSRAAATGLVGNHIDIDTGDWTAPEAGVGGLIDSFYEYMLKGYALFGDARLHAMFADAYPAVLAALHDPPWYVEADMRTATRTSTAHAALAAFWPGLQVLAGALRPAAATARAHHAVWRRLGALPEAYDARRRRAVPGRAGYPLRPELAEAVFYLAWATRDPAWASAARAMVFSLDTVARAPCGFARVADARTHELEDRMDSFLPAETLKYLFAALAPDGHWLRSGRFVLSTEAHPFPVRPVPFPLPQMGSGTRRPKCARRRNTDAAAACGFGLPGSDRPPRPAASSPGLPPDVAALLREHVDGPNPYFRAGDLFVGRDKAYGVVPLQQHLVLVPLGGAALRAARTAARAKTRSPPPPAVCRRSSLARLLRFAVCRNS